MEGKEIYSQMYTATGNKILSNVIMELSDKIQLQLNIVPLQEGTNIKSCEIKMIDKIGVENLGSILDKTSLRELIEELKIVYNQLG